MKKYQIKKQINILVSVLLSSVLLSLLGMYELKKTGTLTHFEREHLEGYYLTKQKIDNLRLLSKEGKSITPDFLSNKASVENRQDLGLFQTIELMKEQAENCLDIVYPPEEVLFNILGYGEALDLCRSEVVESNKLIAILERYSTNEISVSEFLKLSETILQKNQFNSVRFSILVPEVQSIVNYMMFSLVIIISIVTIFLFSSFSRMLKLNLDILCQGIIEISSNKLLSWKFNTVGNNEVSTVARNIETMLDQYAAMISQIHNSAETIRASSRQLSINSQENVRRISEQVLSTEQAATAANEIAVTIQDISNNSDAAATASQRSQKHAKTGNHLVKEAEDNIRMLNESIEEASLAVQALAKRGDDISGISDVILSIADQTNLLALNAAIEAARAGEHGRGFAVVAGEVRDLASRTQKSTEEIRGLVESFQNSANQAIQLMLESKEKSNMTLNITLNAGQELATITDMSNQTSDLSYQVASAIEEQATAVEEVSKSITEIGQATEELDHSSKATNQTATDMAEVAVKLHGLVSQFKVK
ncbi:Methyl-accepting chemotaxis protein (MCP) signalling domain-containing protein [Oceanospirillum multiglobuliferum]|uniref:Methyl-accepting transducer domain-containing protein n=1 Tax=Oceanospirillum multiglobuliferum TaxID=64969 RepID=A0A1T4M4S9_9GAMM|nr:methyl-accepting chemotaxis protein [Oceanospirillum multiglobuliferum]OPX56248.1 hypothetical protein BTE48_04540 [Oceanospirillum multiglobuliferum]SJZ61856.1 Methyl-accepting chemotaxis protein (MCP) signalling domain-containing protein [Oceanospirillum multiglobuliferum]